MASAAAVTASGLAAAVSAPALRVAVVGGSIGGLAAAVALIRVGAAVRVYESSATPLTGRGSSLGFVQVRVWRGAALFCTCLARPPR